MTESDEQFSPQRMASCQTWTKTGRAQHILGRDWPLSTALITAEPSAWEESCSCTGLSLLLMSVSGPFAFKVWGALHYEGVHVVQTKALIAIFMIYKDVDNAIF